MPPKPDCPIHINLRSDGKSKVKGCPGVPNSIPRIETVIEIRPAIGLPFSCRRVEVELTTEQRVTPPSTLAATLGTSIGVSDAVKQYKAFEGATVFAPPYGEFFQEVLALDIPVIIPIDRNLPSSGYFEGWNGLTVHQLTVHVTLGRGAESERRLSHTAPVVVKFYDNLPLYRQFNEPVSEVGVSGDNQVLVETKMAVTCVGPQDAVHVDAVVRSNPHNVKRKKGLVLKSVGLSLVEIFECHDAGLPRRRELTLFSQTVDKGKMPLSTAGKPTSFRFCLPHSADELALYTPSVQDVHDHHVSAPSAAFNRNRNLPKLAQGVPFTHVQSFTTQGRLFSLRYELRLVAKTNHKLVQCVLPLTVSPYNRDSCPYIMQWIVAECQAARDRFGKHVIADIVAMHRPGDIFSALRRFCAPPTVYPYSRQSWSRLGFNPDAFGTVPAASDFVAYID